MPDKSTYMPGTMLAEMVIDIYAGKTTGRITIMHDRHFHAELVGLEFHEKDKRLFFLFENEKRELGAPVREALAPFLLKADMASIVYVDLQGKKMDEGILIPVSRQ